MRPREAFIAVTYSCNARCQMCNIWRTPSSDSLPPAEYLKLPESLRTVNVTGGEPFLRKDLVEVVKAIHTVIPRARLVFSTNGLLTDTILSSLKEIRSFHPNLGAGVSIDGIGKTHDSIRGVPGIFEKAVATVEKLKGAGFEDLRIAMTLVEGNYSEVGSVLSLSQKLGVEFTMTLAHDSDIYFKKSGNVSSGLLDGVKTEMPAIIDRQLRSHAVKDWFRACHTAGIVDEGHRSKFTSRCEAGHLYFFMSPQGDVYPCNVLDVKLGNIASVKSWDDLFTPEMKARADKLVAGCNKDCWMICNARSLMIAHPFRTGSWVVRNKIRAHLK